MLADFLHNFTHNLFKPLLLFFYAGFAIPLLGVKFEFPKVLYQGLTIYLLLAIGWRGGEELAGLQPSEYLQAAGLMLVGVCTNTIIGIVSYFTLRACTGLRRVDAATVAGYYGSDSAGTFVTCQGVLIAGHIAFAAYMPVMLALMEIPGCLVALYLVSRLRSQGMDSKGNMPDELEYQDSMPAPQARRLAESYEKPEFDAENAAEESFEEELVGAGTGAPYAEAYQGNGNSVSTRNGSKWRTLARSGKHAHGQAARFDGPEDIDSETKVALQAEADLALEPAGTLKADKPDHAATAELLHEVFLNPGIYMLFGGIVIGFISRLQGEKVIEANDALFVKLFQGLLCLFLLEMGMTAARKLKDLRTAGWRFVAFGLIAPNVFAIFGMSVAHVYSLVSGHSLEVGTYVLFAVLCGSASYIALPAVQRLAIPEASPTLPLAASLGVTFSYNVTVGIPVYLMVANLLVNYAKVST
jgi:hypothetical protein